ncbi:MAG: LLM class flavin-dependent oxidoreductase [Mesorhizobium sp.]|nr:MAG: LLM class flavin-dependent oxidoreductase [Mesorhizobium sp.]
MIWDHVATKFCERIYPSAAWHLDGGQFHAKGRFLPLHQLFDEAQADRALARFQGGSSRAARDMASRVSDWYFTNGNTPEEIRKQVDDIRTKAKANGHKVRIGVNAFAIARESEQEARAVLDEIIAKANPEAVQGFADQVKNAGKASPEGEGNWAKSSFEDLVQYNDEDTRQARQSAKA